MASFTETMKQWRRLCKAQDDGSDRDVCATCPLGIEIEGCTSIYEGDMDYAKVEQVVTKWAAEHPEPVYPTWAEWLESMHVITVTPIEGCMIKKVLPAFYMFSQIPADIAQKLGIEPK